MKNKPIHQQLKKDPSLLPIRDSFYPKGSICVVTGAASGIGKGLCMELIQRGARNVIAVDISSKSLQMFFYEIKKSNFSNTTGINNKTAHINNTVLSIVQADCGKEEDMKHLINHVEKIYGEIDAFFCNAGILSVGSVENTPINDWDKLWKVNVMQIVYVSKYLFPLYQSRAKKSNNNNGRSGGALIITASAAGLLSLPGGSAYSVTKHGAVALAEWLSMTYGSIDGKKEQGIYVSCLCPQSVRTPMIGDTDGGPAGLDGVLDVKDVVNETLDELSKGTFLITPHKKVRKYMAERANNHEKWIRKMRKLNGMVIEMPWHLSFSRSRL